MNDLDHIRQQLAPLVREKNITHVAASVGITRVALSYYLTGKRGLKLETIAKVAHAVGYHLDVKLRKR